MQNPGFRFSGVLTAKDTLQTPAERPCKYKLKRFVVRVPASRAMLWRNGGRAEGDRGSFLVQGLGPYLGVSENRP